MQWSGQSVIALAVAASGALLVTACGGGAKGATVLRPPTALEVLARALPELTRRHPGGVIEAVYSVGIPRATSIDEWAVQVWAPDAGRMLDYRTVRGQLQGLLAQATLSATPLPPIVRLDGEVVPNLVDSDQALALADDAGASRFTRETGARLRSMSLSTRRDGQVVWSISFTKPGTQSQLTVRLDAMSGTLLERIEGGAGT